MFISRNFIILIAVIIVGVLGAAALSTTTNAQSNSAEKPFTVYEFSTEGFDDCVAVVTNVGATQQRIALQCR